MDSQAHLDSGIAAALAAGEEDEWGNVLEYHWANEITELQDFIAGWIAKINGEGGTKPDPYTVEALFQADLESQEWWQDTHQAYRDAEQQRISDNGTWTENLRIEKADIKRRAEALGYSLTAADLQTLAFNSLHAVTGGWIDDALDRQIIKFKTTVDEVTTASSAPMGVGSIRGSFDTYQGVAAANLVTVTDDRVWGWAHKFQNNELTDEQIKQEIYDIGKNQYGFVDEERWDRWRNAGTTLSDHLNNRRVAIGGVWEIGANEVNWDSQFMQDNLVYSDPNDPTKERFRTSKELKQLAMRNADGSVNERYGKTLGYKTKKADFRNMIYQGFGVI